MYAFFVKLGYSSHARNGALFAAQRQSAVAVSFSLFTVSSLPSSRFVSFFEKCLIDRAHAWLLK